MKELRTLCKKCTQTYERQTYEEGYDRRGYPIQVKSDKVAACHLKKVPDWMHYGVFIDFLEFNGQDKLIKKFKEKLYDIGAGNGPCGFRCEYYTPKDDDENT